MYELIWKGTYLHHMLFFFKQFAFQSEYGIYIWMHTSVLPELISKEQEEDAGFLLSKNVFIHQMTSKPAFLF